MVGAMFADTVVTTPQGETAATDAGQDAERMATVLRPGAADTSAHRMAEVAARDEQLRAKDALIEKREREVAFKQVVIDKLTHEMAVLKRLKFAATSERFCRTQTRP